MFVALNQAGSSTLKLILMQTSDRFNEYDKKRSTQEDRNQHVHAAVNSVFELPPGIKTSVDPLKQLNTFLVY